MVTVSRETNEKFEAYLSLLQKWQAKINLVGPDTLLDARRRHIEDSAQIAELIPSDSKNVMDWGSGAGFPGMVIAILRPELHVHLVESDQRKCSFLRTVSRETKTPVTIHEKRIESIDPATVEADIITARALAPLSALLRYALPWTRAQPATRCFFLKGEKYEEELAEAQKTFLFAVDKHPSRTAPEAAILEISALCIT